MKQIIILLFAISSLLTLSACGKEEEKIVHDVPEEYSVNIQKLAYAEYLSLNNPVVTIEVEGMGEIVIQLFPDIAPNTVNSFIQYATEGDYNGNEFHRVVSGFVIQAGRLDNPCDIEGEFKENGYEENDLSHQRGVISMARVGNDFDSGNSQFFIVQADGLNAQSLNGIYAGFGGMVSGFNVLDYINSMQSQTGEVPTSEVNITSVTVELNGYVANDRVCLTE